MAVSSAPVLAFLGITLNPLTLAKDIANAIFSAALALFGQGAASVVGALLGFVKTTSDPVFSGGWWSSSGMAVFERVLAVSGSLLALAFMCSIITALLSADHGLLARAALRLPIAVLEMALLVGRDRGARLGVRRDLGRDRQGGLRHAFDLRLGRARRRDRRDGNRRADRRRARHPRRPRHLGGALVPERPHLPGGAGGSAHLRGERPSVGGRAAPPVRRRGARSDLLEDRRRPRPRDRLGDALRSRALELLRRRDRRASRGTRRVARRVLRALRAAPPAARRRGDHRRRRPRAPTGPGGALGGRRRFVGRRVLVDGSRAHRRRCGLARRRGPGVSRRRARRRRGRRPRHRRAAPPRHVPLRLVPRGPRARKLPDRAHTPRPRRGPRARRARASDASPTSASPGVPRDATQPPRRADDLRSPSSSPSSKRSAQEWQ